MATPIPAFVSQFIPTADTAIKDDAGNYIFLQTMFGNIWYYLISNRIAHSNGMSLLKAVELALEASEVKAWTVRLSSTYPYKVEFLNLGPGDTSITLTNDLADALGYDESGSTITSGGPASDGTGPSKLFWTPDMPISMTGPTQFDPSVNYGVPSSVGNMQRAPDMTTAAVNNGTQWAAEFRFNGVSPYYRIRETAPYTNYSLENFWTTNLSKGRRLLYWRDRSKITGQTTFGTGVSSPFNYVEYVPQPDLRENFPATPMTPYVLTHWDVNLKLWVTENGETPLSI